MVDFGASEAGKLGGKARAESLTAEQRKAIARRAVEARWAKHGKSPIPRATHTGILKIGDAEIPCAVLDDGTRLLTQYGFFRAIGRSGRPAAGRGSSVEELAPFLALNNLKSFITTELDASTKPIIFRLPTGSNAFGYRAESLPKVCEVYLKARDSGKLLQSQQKFAAACDLIMRGLAHVGIAALVDEATGYQDERDRRALAKILEAFVAKELRPWVHTFPSDFYREMYRLRGLSYPPVGNRMPQYFGVLTNNVVYERLAPGVLDELRRLIPRDEKGRLKHHMHRRLTDDVGHPKLLQHLGAVVALMRINKDKDWDGFIQILDQYYPRYAPTPLFDTTAPEQRALPAAQEQPTSPQ
jgi:hypothetical protein